MQTKKIYEEYHSRVKLQKRIVNLKSFTYRNIIKLIDLNLDNKKTILDVGCGVGTIDFYLAKKGNVVTGIDISKKAVLVARRNANVFGLKNLKFYVGNLHSLNSFSKFDFILSSEIIEHVEDDSGLLKELSKHLKSNGIIFLTTPLETAPLYKLGLTRKFDERVGHLRRYSFKSLNEIVQKNNLKVVKTYYQDGVFRNLFFVFMFFDQLVRVANRFSFVSDILTFIDNISLSLFGPTDICLVIKKK